MNTAVTINLDYLLCSLETCQTAWKVLHQTFVKAGFQLQERLFTITLPQGAAGLRAEKAIEEAAALLELQDIVLGDVLRSCHAFEYQALAALDIPRPGNAGIEVSFMETGAFPAMQGLFSAH